MTIEKAIELLTDLLDTLRVNDLPEHHAAVKLGIKALEKWQVLRELTRSFQARQSEWALKK